MTKVALTSQLRQQLLASGTSEEILLNKFSEWKQGPPDDHYWFGRDVKGTYGLCHVHLIPNNEQDKRAQWDEYWQKGWDSRRKSDRYVLYADGGIFGYLIIALIEDPGAHKLWENASRSELKKFEAIADDFNQLGLIP